MQGTQPKHHEVTAYIQRLYGEYRGCPEPPPWTRDIPILLARAAVALEDIPDLFIACSPRETVQLTNFINWIRDRFFALGFILGRDSGTLGWDDSLLVNIKEEFIGQPSTGDRDTADTDRLDA